jgi:hypothetical protein
MKAAERAAWLKLISEGHDPKLAATALSLPVSVADEKKFQPSIRAALSMATAKLREKVLSLAINNEDIRALEKELERRELTADSGGVTRIERVILKGGGVCVNCGRPPYAKHGKPTNGKAAE